jgi:hypothetical protein
MGMMLRQNNGRKKSKSDGVRLFIHLSGNNCIRNSLHSIYFVNQTKQNQTKPNKHIYIYLSIYLIFVIFVIYLILTIMRNLNINTFRCTTCSLI